MKAVRFIKNICKILVWIALVFVFVSWLGPVFGGLSFALTVFFWSLIVTYIKVWKQDGKEEADRVLRIIFTTDYTLPFTAYGCYCSPKYGVDGRTNGLPPIDELDGLCKAHDTECLNVPIKIAGNKITKLEGARLKNEADRSLMWNMLFSKNSASGIFLLATEVGFLFRIIGRSLVKSV